MSGRTFSLAASVAVSICSVGAAVSLVAYDIFGGPTLAGAMRSAIAALNAPAQKPDDLSRFEQVTLFAKVPVQGSSLVVHTGVEFATIADLAAGRQTKRWCYVIIDGQSGFPRQIVLGSQAGTASPVYRDMKRDAGNDVLAGGLSASALSSIAQSHCRFAGEPKAADGRTRTASAQ